MLMHVLCAMYSWQWLDLSFLLDEVRQDFQQEAAIFLMGVEKRSELKQTQTYAELEQHLT